MALDDDSNTVWILVTMSLELLFVNLDGGCFLGKESDGLHHDHSLAFLTFFGCLLVSTNV